jgi:NADPH-dependent methylglyoxal reductase
MSTSKVLVSGASGLLALHIVGELLEEGYSVIGTVRSQSKADKLTKQFCSKFTNPDLEYVIVPDISQVDAFDTVFQKNKDINCVLHTASPFSFGIDGKLEDIFLKPAVNGTLNILKSIQKFAPQVTKVVITSSMAAIENHDKIGDASFIHTESTWNPIEWDQVENENMAYVTSKKLAERAAWEFLDNADVKFKLNTVNPPFIFGPQYFDQDVSIDNLNTSSSVIANLLRSDPKETSQFNKLALCAVDVRDVAKIHVLALASEINRNRLFAAASRFSEQRILNIINDRFPQLGGKIAKGQPEGEERIPTPAFDNSKTVELLGGYVFIPLEKQVTDTVEQLLKSKF